jgi:hypothetical protein
MKLRLMMLLISRARLFSAWQGGPIYLKGAPGGNNWPLRGGKGSNFDGGIRVPGFISGGAVPAVLAICTPETVSGAQEINSVHTTVRDATNNIIFVGFSG